MYYHIKYGKIIESKAHFYLSLNNSTSELREYMCEHVFAATVSHVYKCVCYSPLSITHIFSFFASSLLHTTWVLHCTQRTAFTLICTLAERLSPCPISNYIHIIPIGFYDFILSTYWYIWTRWWFLNCNGNRLDHGWALPLIKIPLNVNLLTFALAVHCNGEQCRRQMGGKLAGNRFCQFVQFILIFFAIQYVIVLYF